MRANSTIELPPSGGGRSYALAWTFQGRQQLLRAKPWLAMAHFHFRRAVERHMRESGAASPTRRTWAEMNRCFDLDKIIEFSHAWHAWEHPAERDPSPYPWDQELFFGGNDHASDYHDGIRELALKQVDFVTKACQQKLPQGLGLALDLGAGRGVQMSALRSAGLIDGAICVDTPFVLEKGRTEAPQHQWIGGDLRTLDVNPLPSVDLIWIGNLLHHYSAEENQAMVNRFAAKLSPRGTIVVQEYVIDAPGNLGLVAAALGVHFALTTSQGRNFTQQLIGGMLAEAVPGIALDSRVDGAVSSLLFYRCKS